MLASASVASASGDGHDTYQNECGACHLAYPAKFLPVKAWDSILAHLDEHFGDVAELPADDLKQVKTWLDDNGYKVGMMSGLFGRFGKNEVPERITTSKYFLSKHDEIDAQSVKNNPGVKSFSRCDACHTTAASGDFDEDNVRIP